MPWAGWPKASFSKEAEELYTAALKFVQGRPVVKSRQALSGEARLGIVYQIVPDTGRGKVAIDDLDTILEVGEVAGWLANTLEIRLPLSRRKWLTGLQGR